MAQAPINPIIPGFAPDPSIVKVGGWFFLVNSTFHMFPGLPIYASQDLLSWQQIGNAIHRPGQLSLAAADTRMNPLEDLGEVMACTGGLYAPTLRYHDGTFYLVCTNVLHAQPRDVTQNFVVTTQDIWAGAWSDPVYFAFGGIDPSLLFDDDGRVYVQGSAAPGPYTKIKQFEVDLATGAQLSEERVIWEGTGDIYPEGPHMYKRRGWYVLLISEGGTHEGHKISMARSRDVWGPYEACPHNPILTARGTDEYIRYTGHCDVLADDQGQWWGVCLGVRKDAGARFVMGRETFLTRGAWDADDWLALERVKSNPRGLVRAGSGSAAPLAPAARPNIDFLYIRDAHLDRYALSSDGTGAVVTLTATPVDLTAPHASPTFVGKRQRCLAGQTRVTLPAIPAAAAAAGLRCGLACFKDEHRFVRIYFDATPPAAAAAGGSGPGAIAFELRNNAQSIARSERHDLPPGTAVLSLCIEYTEQAYRLLYAAPSPGSAADTPTDWTCLAVVDTLHMTDPDFVGPVLGVFATSAADSIEVELRGLSIK